MEYDGIQTLVSAPLKKNDFQKQLKKIAEISTIAKDRLDYEHAHDVSIQKAINIVEKFLRRTHRLCYGGQALNAHLPRPYKFYDPEKTVPDYDFFTPNQDEDIVELVQNFQKAGFREISVRLGIHEGTFKIYVNYVPVADITFMEPGLYSLLSEREYVYDKISYLDADTLRMLIYLELSRPKGDVDRWPKIYERLLLLEHFVPIGVNTLNSKILEKGNKIRNPLTSYENNSIMKYIVHNGNIFAGADLINIYEKAIVSKKIKLGKKYPIIFFSNNIEQEGAKITEILEESVNKRKYYPISQHYYQNINGDMLPALLLINKGSRIAVIIIQESACHSYYNYLLPSGETMKIASIDTLVTLFFSLGIRGRGGERVNDSIAFIGSFESLARQLVMIAKEARSKPNIFPFPFLSIDCEGEQKTFESLIREKVKRVRRESVRKRLRRLRNMVRNSENPSESSLSNQVKLHTQSLKNGKIVPI